MDLIIDPELRFKLETGQIINSKKDWEEFRKLSREEQIITQKRLKANPALTLAKAMPPRKQMVSAEHLELINSLPHISHEAKRQIASGTIAVDTASVKKMMKLEPPMMQMLSAVIEDKQIDSLKKGLMVLDGKVQPRSRAQAVALTIASVMSLAMKIDEKILDLKAVGVDVQEFSPAWGAFKQGILSKCIGEEHA
jgi:hypothetical protein